MQTKTARHWGLMNAMFHKAGVDLGAGLIEERLDISDLGEAVARCTECTDVPGCQSHLEAPDTAGVPDFCRNAALIARLAP